MGFGTGTEITDQRVLKILFEQPPSTRHISHDESNTSTLRNTAIFLPSEDSYKMADGKDREGLWIPTLTKANHESWFRQNRIKLRGKGVFYTCEVTLRSYAQIALADDIAEITTGVENLDIEEKGIKTRIVLSLEKKKKYQEDEATGLSLLFRSLSEDDQALNDQYEAIFDFWAYLKKKYS